MHLDMSILTPAVHQVLKISWQKALMKMKRQRNANEEAKTNRKE